MGGRALASGVPPAALSFLRWAQDPPGDVASGREKHKCQARESLVCTGRPRPWSAAPQGQGHLKGPRRQPGPGPRGTWLGLWTLFHVFTLQIYSNWSSECAAAHAASAFKAGRKPDRPPDPRLGARPTKRQTEPGRHPPSPAFCVTAVRGSRPGPTPRQPSACSGDRGKQSPQSMEADDPSTWHCPEPPLNATCPRGAGRLPVPADGDGDR